MNAWIAPVMASLSTLLIISVIYITQSIRHKQRMTLIEKGLDPDYFRQDDLRSWTRFGALLIGAGTGFLLAFTIDLIAFNSRSGTEPLYPSITAICAGIAVLISKQLTEKK